MSMGNARAMIRRMLDGVGLDVRRTPRQSESLIREYLDGGAIPWSPGYIEAKRRLIAGALSNAGLMEAFRTGAQLPPAYGVGFDERCVEYPWLFARLGGSTGTLLDAGSVLNHEHVLRHAPFQKNQLHILTLAPEPNCFWGQGISYLFADLRDIPVRDNYYRNTACVSTLEHVGCDNYAASGLPAHRETRPDDFILVIKELHRTLEPGGALHLTVPYGRYRNHGTFQQFDAGMIARVIEAFDPAPPVETTFFRYTAAGWSRATQEECADCEFAEWILRVWRGEVRQADAVVDADRAAASRAVACLRLVKRGAASS